MITLYSLKGCPMCEHAKTVLAEKRIDFTQIMDADVMSAKGITHVPVLETEDGNLLSGKSLVQYLNRLQRS